MTPGGSGGLRNVARTAAVQPVPSTVVCGVTRAYATSFAAAVVRET